MSCELALYLQASSLASLIFFGKIPSWELLGPPFQRHVRLAVSLVTLAALDMQCLSLGIRHKRQKGGVHICRSGSVQQLGSFSTRLRVIDWLPTGTGCLGKADKGLTFSLLFTSFQGELAPSRSSLLDHQEMV